MFYRTFEINDLYKTTIYKQKETFTFCFMAPKIFGKTGNLFIGKKRLRHEINQRIM